MSTPNFLPFQLRLEHILPGLGDLIGRDEILVIRDSGKPAHQRDDVSILWVNHFWWNGKYSMLGHAQKVDFPKMGQPIAIEVSVSPHDIQVFGGTAFHLQKCAGPQIYALEAFHL